MTARDTSVSRPKPLPKESSQRPALLYGVDEDSDKGEGAVHTPADEAHRSADAGTLGKADDAGDNNPDKSSPFPTFPAVAEPLALAYGAHKQFVSATSLAGVHIQPETWPRPPPSNQLPPT